MNCLETRSEAEVNDILDAYAKHLGIKRTRNHTITEDPLWDGEALAYFTLPADTSHEIAHWILASDKQRKLQNYGWNFDWGHYVKPRRHYGTKLKAAPPSESEIHACLLGFSMMVRLGLKGVRDIYWDYGFYSGAGGLISDVARRRQEVQPQVAAFQTWLTEREA